MKTTFNISVTETTSVIKAEAKFRLVARLCIVPETMIAETTRKNFLPPLSSEAECELRKNPQNYHVGKVGAMII